MPNLSSVTLTSRIFIIIQLSLVFAYLIWAGMQPMVAGYSHTQMMASLQERVEEGHEEWWKTLSPTLRHRVSLATEEETQNDWISTLKASIHVVLFAIPAFLQAWMLFSLLICFFLLYQIQGSLQATWLLPIIMSLFAWFNWQTAPAPLQAPDTSLFPTEEYLVSNYVDGDLHDSIQEQYQQLKEAWNAYLVAEWTEKPFLSLDYAEWRFSVARLDAYKKAPKPTTQRLLTQRRSLVSLVLLVVWNFLFAAVVTWQERKRV